MDLPGGRSSSIQQPINIDLNVLDEARMPMQDSSNPIRNDHFSPARDSNRHKRKTPSSSSSSSSDANTETITNTSSNTSHAPNLNNLRNISSNTSHAPNLNSLRNISLNTSHVPNLNNLRNEDFVRNTRARPNHYVIDLEDDENNEDEESDVPLVDPNPNPVASESVPSVVRVGDDDDNNNNNNNNNNEGNQERQALILDEERDGDSDNGSNGSDVDYSGLLRAIVAVRERREGRGRVLTEIRNVLDILRNSDNVGNEDISFVHRVMSMARNNLFDRHRDMRLDVDNMSYEELLALEERIGNVNTGLNEEKVMSCLKPYTFIIPSSSSDAIEPCCICQEEYLQDVEMGRLGCGHDFHLACIKQWLSHKNACPICKTAALDT